MPIAVVPNFALAAPEIFLAVAAMALLVVGAFMQERSAARVVSYGSVLALLSRPALPLAATSPWR